MGYRRNGDILRLRNGLKRSACLIAVGASTAKTQSPESVDLYGMKKEMLKTREPEDEGEMETIRWFSPLTSPRRSYCR
jgi:hypothetical protein